MQTTLSDVVAEPAVSASPALSSHLDQFYIRRSWLYLFVIIAAYALAAALFAVRTPEWQNPDEPAHYNNIAQIASGAGLPVLHAGDYNEFYLRTLVDAGFPRHLPISPLRYEAYQPPLFYLAAAPVFIFTDGSLLALRLFNVLLGAVTITLVFLCLTLVFPTKPLIAVGATAFVALLPMHMAMNAAVNNDGLAELLLAAAVLTLLRWMRREFYDGDALAATQTRNWRPATWATLASLGVFLGLSMATKIYAYLALAICAGVVWLVIWRRPRIAHAAAGMAAASGWRRAAAGLAGTLWVVVPAVLLVAPLWLRNLLLYGGWDFLGLQFHDAVVVGQPTTLEWIQANGWLAYMERTLSLTFHSFWGVFGWLGVFMDMRVYTLLLVFSGAIFLGVLWAFVRYISGYPETDMDRFQFWVLGLFGVIIGAAFLAYGWYNVKFVQHQGRYFFWGLLPISCFVALGWRELMQPLQGKVTGFLAGVLALALAGLALTNGMQDRLTIAAIGALAVLLVTQPFLLSGAVDPVIIGTPQWVQAWLGVAVLRPVLQVLRVLAWATPFVLLWLLDLMIPVWYIGPQLGQ